MLNYLSIACLVLIALSACGSRPGPDSISSHPTYSNQATSCTSNCHSSTSTISPNPLTTNGTGAAGKHVIHVTSKGIACGVCHYNYPVSLATLTTPITHFDGTLDTGNPAITIVNISVAGTAGLWINDTGPQTGSCSLVACHGTAVLDWYGANTWTTPTSCGACHIGSLDPVLTNGTGVAGKHVVHVSVMHLPCARCHAGYPGATGHMNGTLDTANPAVSLVQFDAANPAGVWTNDTGSQTGACASLACHAGTTLDWYGTNTWTTPAACAICHGAAVGTRRQVLGGGGDFNKESHHVIDYAQRTTETITTADCNVCHTMTEHMSGVVRLSHKDTGTVVVYVPASPASLEPFCLSCHDADGVTTDASGATPFSDGNTLGAGMNAAGNRIASSWTGSNPTHRNNGLTCAGTGAPNTGCHGSNGAINMHGSPARGLLSRNMTFTIAPTSSYSEADYQLCFGCHSSYPAVTKEVVLGYRLNGNYDKLPLSDLPRSPYVTLTATIQSQFRDRYLANPASYPPYWGVGFSPAYNSTFWFPGADTYRPLHNFHLLGNYADTLLIPGLPNWFTSNYRGDAAEQGRITCTACHNVHGTNNGIRNTHDELLLSRGTGSGADLFTRLPAPPAGRMSQDPMNCTADCHGTGGKAFYWYSPANE